MNVVQQWAENLSQRPRRVKAQYDSYVTGLQYQKTPRTIPQPGDVFYCIHDPHNRYDAHAIQVVPVGQYHHRIGFVPRQLAQHVHQQFQTAGDLMLLCVIKGGTTQRSAQCVYVLFE